MRVPVVLAAALLVSSCTSGPQQEPAATASTEGRATVAGTTTIAPSRSASQDTATAAAVPGFTFAAAGDLGANRNTAASLERLDRSAADFFLALGDLDYDETRSDAAWCDYVQRRLPSKGGAFPFELLAGNHEADTGEDGRVRRHAACLPDRLGAEGSYPTQYAFGYPAGAPTARFVLVSPRLTVDGHTYDYRPGTADRRWLVDQVTQAREAGQWVVVAMHYPCLSTGSGHRGCSSGRAVHNLVLKLGVDLLLVGHNHVYERSKQVALSGSCPRVTKRYDAACVADGGEDGAYRRGAGTVQVTAGRFGGRPMSIADGDPDRRWFTKARAGSTGYLQVHLGAERLEARFVRSSGSVRDRFVIE
jgi:hypothetical protein